MSNPRPVQKQRRQSASKAEGLAALDTPAQSVPVRPPGLTSDPKPDRIRQSVGNQNQNPNPDPNPN
ncbi:uncharacterized protein N7511_002043 [Penicillium nucicola]|uniref:uncharacterized protein n=1 Tax=Penicillium nucicola TaxID=1850975 RepID=UPI002544FE2D|nr:uncharacterized protein N7511_002043 [Penicillium nucicola]KAJ5769992.1 hypothetical protein N7511_002043 [Penicillium nucicola]